MQKTSTQDSFNQATLFADMTEVFDRYEATLKTLRSGTPAPNLPLGGMPAYLPQAYDLFTAMQSLVWNPAHDVIYPFNADDHMPARGLTFADLPKLSQSAIAKTYIATVDSMLEQTRELFHVAKYGTNIDRLVEQFDTYAGPLADHDNTDLTTLTLNNQALRQGYGTEPKVNGLMRAIIHQHVAILNTITPYLEQSTLEALGNKTLLELPGTGVKMSYLVDAAEANAAVEANAMNYHGVFFRMLDVPKPYDRLLARAAQAPQTRTTMAKWVLSGNDGYYNTDLAREHDLNEPELRRGLAALILQRVERETESSDTAGIHLREGSPVAPATLEDDMRAVQALIDDGKLAVHRGGKNIYNVSLVHSADQYLCPEMDHVTATISTAFGGEGLTMERRDHRLIVDCSKGANYAAMYYMDQCLKRSAMRDMLGMHHNQLGTALADTTKTVPAIAANLRWRIA